MTTRTAAHQIDYRKAQYERSEHDWYEDPPAATEALLRVERFQGLCYDPACGQGTIPKTLRAHGLAAIGSDIADRGFGSPGVDFLTAELPTVACVVTNPPYRTVPNPARARSISHAGWMRSTSGSSPPSGSSPASSAAARSTPGSPSATASATRPSTPSSTPAPPCTG